MDQDHEETAGLLMEAAERHLQVATDAMERLDIATRGLNPVMREVVAQAVAEAAKREFEVLRAETQRTAQALQGIRGGVSWNLGVLACGIALVTVFAAVSGIYLFGGYRSGGQVAAPAAPSGLKGDPGVLAEFARRGLQVEVSLCGEARRPCVKVEPKASTYGPRRDFMIVPAQPAP